MAQYKKIIDVGQSELTDNSNVVAIVGEEVKQVPVSEFKKKFNSKQSVSITIPTDGWVSDSESDFPLSIDISYDGITEEMVPMLTILPESQQIATECELCSTVRTLDGVLRVFSKYIPSSEISCILTLF